MISVILCGGAGSRLWPASRELFPKPFLRLADGQSFIQKAFMRGAKAPEAEKLLTITSQEIFFKVKEEFKETKLSMDSSYILEPFGRNTGPAIAAAALEVKRSHGENTPMLILASDHLIGKPEAFAVAVERALELAKKDMLVTFGIKPTAPETGFGYIETDGERVVRFVEKPNEEKAREYLASGRFLWNSGMFCFKAGVILAEFSRHAPEVLRAVEACIAASKGPHCPKGDPDKDDECLPLDPDTFAAAPSLSVDYAVMEKSDRMAVVHCDMEWNDVGSWPDLCGLNPVDADGNHVYNPENAVLHETRNCNIRNKERLVAALGVENLLIVDTADALLVADNSKAQDVKIIYNRLKSENHEAYKHHRTMYRPWGSYTMLEQGPRFKIKRLLIKPSASISLQLHRHRSEHWIVVSGMATVTCGEEAFFVNTNESVYIKAGIRHRVANEGRIDLVIIEVQSGDYLGEDDIERFDDQYGRC